MHSSHSQKKQNMKQNIALKSALISIAITIVLAVIGTSLVGDGLIWFENLQKPSFLVSLNIFYLVAAVYNIVCAYIVYRLLHRYFSTKETSSLHAVYAVVTMMAANELWNYFFMGLQSTKNGFIGIIIFSFFVIFAIWKVQKVDKVSYYLLLLYSLWVTYDLVWTYALWQLNV